MRRIIILVLVFVLSGCAAAPAKVPNTQVPVLPPATDTVAAAPASDTPVPAPTDTEIPTQAAASSSAAASAPASSAPAANSFGDITFTNRKDTTQTVTGTGGFSVKSFAYSCANTPNDVTLTVSTTNADIYKVNYVYRLVAMDAPTITSGWSGDAKMTSTGGGNFSIDIPASQFPSDWRTRKAWMDVQFIAFNNIDITFTSPAFTRLINFNECK